MEMTLLLPSKWRRSKSTRESQRSSLARTLNCSTRKTKGITCRFGDQISHTVKEIVQKGGYDKVIAATSAFGKDVIPRLGGLLDVQPITDVIQIIVTCGAA